MVRGYSAQAWIGMLILGQFLVPAFLWAEDTRPGLIVGPELLYQEAGGGPAILTFRNGTSAEVHIIDVENEMLVFREVAGSEYRIPLAVVESIQRLSKPDLLLCRAEVQFVQGKPAEAERSLKHALEVDPGLSRLPEVLELRQAIQTELRVERAAAFEDLFAEIDGHLDRQNSSKALDLLDQALYEYPDDVELLEKGVWIEYDLYKYDAYYPLDIESRYEDRLREHNPGAEVLDVLRRLALVRGERAEADERDRFALQNRIEAEIEQSRNNRTREVRRKYRDNPFTSQPVRAEVVTLPSTMANERDRQARNAARALRSRIAARNARSACNAVASVPSCPY